MTWVMVRPNNVEFAIKENHKIGKLFGNDLKFQFKELLRNHYQKIEEVKDEDYEDRYESRTFGDQLMKLETWDKLTGTN